MSNKGKSQPTHDQEQKREVIYDLNLQVKAALVRTMLAADNSMMAWIRTCISLFAFGFSIITFFDYLGKGSEDVKSIKITIIIGIALIALGVFSLTLAVIEHKHARNKLLELGLPRISRYLLPMRAAFALIIIAIISLIILLFNVSLYFV